MKKETVFGLGPEQLDRLLSLGTDSDASVESEAGPMTAQERHADGAGGASAAGGPSAEGSGSGSLPASLAAVVEQPGGWIGRYRLISMVGEGGMGIVYLARQEQPIKRQVALKVIKPGMDSKRVIARFEAERQALALLDHPNIARVFDAGTTEAGRPYFVMEYVQGRPITEYCDRYKLTIEQRLRLFQQVCSAVEHAHQKGIIHRDIKPSNILVRGAEDKATPKIIDFGVAKALSQPLVEGTLTTDDSRLLGTPEYMSPEQVDMVGQDIDTRSDVYSLGVLLYVLLAGVLPFDSKELRESGIEHIRKVIRETDPKTPSTRLTRLGEEAKKVAASRGTHVAALAKHLHRELEWIPLKAMRKERSERYRSAAELADDIENYLKGVPLIAGPPAMLYRLRKLAQRHHVLVTMSSLLAVTLVIGFIVSTTMWYRAKHALDTIDRLEQHIEADQALSTAQKYRALGRYEEALNEIEHNLDPAASGPQVRLLRANLLLDMGREADAEQEARQLTSSEPVFAGAAYFVLARIYFAGDRAQAEEYRQTAEALMPSTPEAYLLRAMVAETPAQSIAWLSQAVALDPTYYPSYKARALLYYGLQDFGRLSEDAAILIALRPADPLGYTLRAAARHASGRFEEAISDHTEAIALCTVDTELADLYYQRCQSYMQSEQYAPAAEDAKQGIALASAKWELLVSLFKALFSLGRYEAARNVYLRGVQKYPHAENYIQDLAREYAISTIAAGRDLALPDALAHKAPFAAMGQAVQSYRGLAGRALRLPANGPVGLHSSCWSPDGKQIAYARGWDQSRSTTTLIVMPTASPNVGIEVFDLESHNRRMLVNRGTHPKWSPDGRYIAFVKGYVDSIDRSAEIWITTPEAASPHKLVQGTWPIWSGDSRRIFFKSILTDEQVYCVAIDDPNARPREFTRCAGRFDISEDERLLAYASPTEIVVEDLQSNATVTRWPTPWPLDTWDVGFSPNGAELAISGLCWGGTAWVPTWGSWIYDIAGEQAWHVLDPPGYQTVPSPEGSRLALHLGTELWIVPLEAAVPTYRQIEMALPHEAFTQRMIQQKTDALVLDPCNVESRLERALLYISLGEFEKAESDLNRMIDHATPEHRGQRFQLMWWTGQFCRHDVHRGGELLGRKAVEYLERLITSQAWWVAYYRNGWLNPFQNLVGLHCRRGNHEEGVQWALRLMRNCAAVFEEAAADRSLAPDPNAYFTQGYSGFDASSDAYDTKGSGHGIAGVSDQFHFAYGSLEGDGSIVARIMTLEKEHPSSQAGVMIRSSLQGDAENACVFVTPEGKVHFQCREQGGARTLVAGTYDGPVALPHWIRLTRKGDTFAAWHSQDGSRWKPISDVKAAGPAEVSFPMEDKVCMGLAVTSHAGPLVVAEARVASVRTTGSVGPGTPFTESRDIGFLPTWFPDGQIAGD